MVVSASRHQPAGTMSRIASPALAPAPNPAPNHARRQAVVA